MPEHPWTAILFRGSPQCRLPVLGDWRSFLVNALPTRATASLHPNARLMLTALITRRSHSRERVHQREIRSRHHSWRRFVANPAFCRHVAVGDSAELGESSARRTFVVVTRHGWKKLRPPAPRQGCEARGRRARWVRSLLQDRRPVLPPRWVRPRSA